MCENTVSRIWTNQAHTAFAQEQSNGQSIGRTDLLCLLNAETCMVEATLVDANPHDEHHVFSNVSLTDASELSDRMDR